MATLNLNIVKVHVKHNRAKKRFEVILGDKIAVVDYLQLKDRLVILHTEVPREFTGKGIAGMMARAALDHARKLGLKVSTICSFIAVFIQKNPEYHDLIFRE